jgi:hypothetical protein
MKSGRVVLRIQLEKDYVDLELDKGIEPTFYQELIHMDVQNGQAHFLSALKQKLVATPMLDSLFK